MEAEKVLRSERSPNISWKLAGIKLSELADNFASTEPEPEDRAVRAVRRSVGQQRSDADSLINNVFKCVQAVGLLLIMKKIDKMLK